MDLVTFVSSVVGAGSLLIGVASFINGKQDARRMTSRVTGCSRKYGRFRRIFLTSSKQKKNSSFSWLVPKSRSRMLIVLETLLRRRKREQKLRRRRLTLLTMS